MAKVTQLKIELEQEEDGRWIGEVPTMPGVMAYGQTRAAALAAVQALALRAMADRLEHNEAVPVPGILGTKVMYEQSRNDRTAN
jgi:predicted RNase H-like HicB family nuclease